MEWRVLQIAAPIDTRREVVSQWRKRFFEERLVGLEERARPGHPGLFSPEHIIEIGAGLRVAVHLGLSLSRLSAADVTRRVE